MGRIFFMGFVFGVALGLLLGPVIHNEYYSHSYQPPDPAEDATYYHFGGKSREGIETGAGIGEWILITSDFYKAGNKFSFTSSDSSCHLAMFESPNSTARLYYALCGDAMEVTVSDPFREEQK